MMSRNIFLLSYDPVQFCAQVSSLSENTLTQAFLIELCSVRNRLNYTRRLPEISSFRLTRQDEKMEPDSSVYTLHSWSRRQAVPSKILYPLTRVHCVTTQDISLTNHRCLNLRTCITGTVYQTRLVYFLLTGSKGAVKWLCFICFSVERWAFMTVFPWLS